MSHNFFVFPEHGFCSKPERTSAVAAGFIKRKNLGSSDLLVENKSLLLVIFLSEAHIVWSVARLLIRLGGE